MLVESMSLEIGSLNMGVTCMATRQDFQPLVGISFMNCTAPVQVLAKCQILSNTVI